MPTGIDLTEHEAAAIVAGIPRAHGDRPQAALKMYSGTKDSPYVRTHGDRPNRTYRL